MRALALVVSVGAALALAGAGARTRAHSESGAPTSRDSILGVLGMDNVTEAFTPRGIRNNNPLNIELGDPWQGLAPEQTDGRFAQFIDPRFGYRAAAKIMSSYAARNIRTLQQIIATWAPAHENNVRAYVDSVAKRSGLAPVQVLGKHHYPALFEAMTQHENGQQPYSLELIAEGVSWA